MSPLNSEVIAKTAKLAQLEISAEQIARLTDELDGIFNLFTTINTAEITATAPLSHPLGETQRLRADVAVERDMLPSIELNAPLAEERFITVPKVIE